MHAAEQSDLPHALDSPAHDKRLACGFGGAREVAKQ